MIYCPHCDQSSVSLLGYLNTFLLSFFLVKLMHLKLCIKTLTRCALKALQKVVKRLNYCSCTSHWSGSSLDMGANRKSSRPWGKMPRYVLQKDILYWDTSVSGSFWLLTGKASEQSAQPFVQQALSTPPHHWDCHLQNCSISSIIQQLLLALIHIDHLDINK